jgi:hypothetical protein
LSSGYRFPYQPKFFKDDLEYKNQIRDQQLEVRKSLNYGKIGEIANTVRTLQLLVTDKMIPKDDKFETEIDDLEGDLQAHYVAKEEEYAVKINGSLCPDVVDKPSRTIAPRWYYEGKASILFNFFDRLGLGLEHEREGYF